MRTNRQTDKQKASNILPRPTDIVGVGNKLLTHFNPTLPHNSVHLLVLHGYFPQHGLGQLHVSSVALSVQISAFTVTISVAHFAIAFFPVYLDKRPQLYSH